MVCLIHRVLTASVQRVQEALPGKEAAGACFIVLLVVPKLKIP